MLSIAAAPAAAAAAALPCFKRVTLGWPVGGQLRCALPSGGGIGFLPSLRVRQSYHSRCKVPAVLQVDDRIIGSGGEEEEEELQIGEGNVGEVPPILVDLDAANATGESKMKERISKRKNEQTVYMLAAMASTTGFTTMAVAAVVYRFIWQMPASGEMPYAEIGGTFALAVGAAVGMEYWARWAHKALWHASLWHMHESHHRPRDGPFETNDVFAIINAVPAISLMLYGFLNKGLIPGLCFGAGLGITMFGIAYMFVHDGLVHRRFPVGPIAGVPYLQKVAAAHQLHHADLFDGVPYGLFLGPKELEEVGGEQELDKLMKQRARVVAGVRQTTGKS